MSELERLNKILQLKLLIRGWTQRFNKVVTPESRLLHSREENEEVDRDYNNMMEGFAEELEILETYRGEEIVKAYARANATFEKLKESRDDN